MEAGAGRAGPKSNTHLIRGKLAEGSLPQNSIPRVWGGAGKGEICDACAKVVTPEQFVMEGISTDDGKKGIQFHVKCFYLWTRCESYRPAKDVTAARNLLRRPDMTACRLKIPDRRVLARLPWV